MKQTPTTLSSRNAHSRDANIQFQEEGHKYTILTDLASKYTSCTTWNHTHFAPFDADAIITSIMKGKNWNPSNKYWGLTADQIKHQEAWKASRDLDFPIALMKSGRAGENENEHYRSMTMTMRH